MTVPSPNVQVQGVGSVTADQLNSNIQTILSVAQLRTFTGAPGMVINLQGTVNPGDGGQGLYYWKASNTSPDNGSSIIVPTGATLGGWILLPNIIVPVVYPPSGRLTLQSSTPIMASSVTGATSVYYTPYMGNTTPIWSGTQWIPVTFIETNQLLSDASRSPAAAAPSSLYDMFLWTPLGAANPICTRGPAWATATSRGTGAGTTQLTRNNGFLVNQFNIGNGPAAGFGMFVGTIATNAAGTVDYALGGTGTGGVLASINVWNNFNRVNIAPFVTDTNAVYTYIPATVRQAGGSLNNKIIFLSGLAEDGFSADFVSEAFTVPVSLASVATGYGLDSLTTYYQVLGQTAPGVAVVLDAGLSKSILPLIGSHFVAMLEQSDGINANTFNAAGNQSLSLLMRG